VSHSKRDLNQFIFTFPIQEKKLALLLEFFNQSININWIHVLIDCNAAGGNCFSQIDKNIDSKYFWTVVFI
jgi:hypothetical protein